RDLDVLRSVLGDEKLTYLGYSYGTRLGTTYAEMFPDNVRALVLDGAVLPHTDTVAQVTGQVAGFQLALESFLEWCTERDDCPLGDDPETAEQELNRMLEPLKEKPLSVKDRKLSYNDAVTAVIQAMYSDELWILLRDGLEELANDEGTTLLLLADAYLGRDTDGRYSTQMDAFLAIRCVDEPPVKDRELLRQQIEQLRAQAGDNRLLIDPDQPVALDACAFWPVPPTSEPHELSVPGLPQVLVISTTGDPATPYQAGVDLARMLNARLLTYDGDQHTVALQGVPCVDEVVVDYLVDLTLPDADVDC
ncbi:MAG TPA: alpha/beta hydrolase, partial [Pseudonocardiaceae bacterium]